MHAEIFREIGNIGVGNALTALSKLVNRSFDMKTPIVQEVEFKNFAKIIGGEDKIITSMFVKVSGEIDGIMMFISTRKSFKSLLYMLFEQESEEEEFSKIEISALEEIGNIICSAYLNALAALINKKIVPSVPYIAEDMANAILSVPAIQFSKISEKVLLIESVFTSHNIDNVTGYFILVPEKESYDIIFSSLGVV